jgi:integrase
MSTQTTIPNDSDESLPPAPRRAAEELPTQEQVRALGINLDLDQARTVACLLSRFLGRGHSQSRSHLKAMMYALSTACALEVVHDGEAEPAPHPALATATWPDASSTFHRLGITAATLEAYWREARDRASDSCFPLAWLAAFFPPPLWSAVATLVSWGPERTRVRLEQTTRALAKRRTTRERRRRAKDSPLAYGTIDAWLTALMALLDELVGLRSALKASRRPALPVDLVEPWVVAPPRPSLREAGVRRSGQDNSGPSLEEVERALHGSARDYEQNPGYPYHRLRRLILLSACGLLGPRATALRTASVADFKSDVVGPDSVRRDVLEIRPGKTWDQDEVHRLPLPKELGQWFRDWIHITGREIGEDSPLFPGKKPKPGKKLVPISEVGFYAAIAGTKNGEQGSRALIPLNGDPYIGYRPHGFRHTAQQLLERAAVELKAENPGAFDHLKPEDFSRAVLGHTLTRSTPDVYRDLDRSKLTHLVVDKAWEILWGNGGVRTGVDPEAIQQARERVESLRRMIRALESESHRLVRVQSDIGVRARKVQGDRLTQALIESNAAAAQLDDCTRQLMTLQESLAEAEKVFDEARTREVPLPDDLSDKEHQRLVEAATGHIERPDSLHDGPLADSLLVSDLAELWATTEQTINRWYRSGSPDGRAAPWDNEAWLVEGPRNKRLPVDALNHASLSEAQKERLLALRRKRGLAQAA